MIDKSYVMVVENIKEQIRIAQHRAILNANKEMIILFILECIMAPLFVLIGLIFVLIKRWLYGK